MLRRPPRFQPRPVALLFMLGTALALGGCGIKGPLEPPPGVADVPHPHAEGTTPKPKDSGTVKPNRPFVLDGLL